jgi:multiple sugar transport system substrate-binding protein
MEIKTKGPLMRLFALASTSALLLAGCAGGTAEEASEATSETTETAASSEEVTITLARFFGDCDDTTEGVTDVKLATSECEVIQILTNAFNAEDNGITVEKLGGQAWGDYYTQLSTTFAGGDRPDVAVMHQHRLPDYVSRGLITPVGDMLAEKGVDWNDYTAPALGAVTFDGDYYGVPFDIHGSLWHVNVDLFEEAGLVDASGAPIAASSPDELIEQCQAIQAATGKQFFAHDWFEYGVGARLFLGLVWQQGGDLSDGVSATVDTPEAAAALGLLNDIASECSNPEQGYTDSQAAFLAGEVAVLHNGTWVVDQYNREAPFTYVATDIPGVFGGFGSWGDSHMWVMPVQEEVDEARQDAALKFMAYLYENVGNWAIGTGHIAPRVSVIASDEYANAPQRSNYAETADKARMVPAVPGWAGAWDALAEELNATWVTGKDQAQALVDAESRMNEALAG